MNVAIIVALHVTEGDTALRESENMTSSVIFQWSRSSMCKARGGDWPCLCVGQAYKQHLPS